MPQRPAISPQQCRAARGWLGWTQGDLGDQAGIYPSLISRFEGRGEPLSFTQIHAIDAAFKRAGIAFTPRGITGPVEPFAPYLTVKDKPHVGRHASNGMAHA